MSNRLRETKGTTQLLPDLEPPLARSIAHFTLETRSYRLLRCSSNLPDLLGCRLEFLLHDANIFLRHAAVNDRFNLLSKLEQTFSSPSELSLVYNWTRPQDNQTIRIFLQGATTSDLFKGIIVDLQTAGTLIPPGADSIREKSISYLPLGWLVLDQDLRIDFVHLPKTLKKVMRRCSELFSLEKFAKGFIFSECFCSPQKKIELTDRLQALLKTEPKAFEELYQFTPETFIKFSARVIKEAGHPSGLIITIADCSQEQTQLLELRSYQQKESFNKFSVNIVNNLKNTLQALIAETSSLTIPGANADHLTRSLESIQKKAITATELSEFLMEQSEDQFSPADLSLITIGVLHKIDQIFKRPCRVTVGFSNVPLISIQTKSFQVSLKQAIEDLLALSSGGGTLLIETRAPEESPLGRQSAELRMRLSNQDFTPSSSTPTLHADFIHCIESAGGITESEFREDSSLEIRIYLPTLSVKSEQEGDINLNDPPEILIVDDDGAVRETVASLLRSFGYRCCTASNHEIAHRVALRFQDDLRLVLIDALLPDKNGLEILQSLKDICLNAHFVAFSGAPGEITEAMLEQGASELITKPVTPSKLNSVLKQLLKQANNPISSVNTAI